MCGDGIEILPSKDGDVHYMIVLSLESAQSGGRGCYRLAEYYRVPCESIKQRNIGVGYTRPLK